MSAPKYINNGITPIITSIGRTGLKPQRKEVPVEISADLISGISIDKTDIGHEKTLVYDSESNKFTFANLLGAGNSNQELNTTSDVQFSHIKTNDIRSIAGSLTVSSAISMVGYGLNLNGNSIVNGSFNGNSVSAKSLNIIPDQSSNIKINGSGPICMNNGEGIGGSELLMDGGSIEMGVKNSHSGGGNIHMDGGNINMNHGTINSEGGNIVNVGDLQLNGSVFTKSIIFNSTSVKLESDSNGTSISLNASALNINGNTGYTGTFPTSDGRMVSVMNGLIISVLPLE